jgi:hypothetical protein
MIKTCTLHILIPLLPAILQDQICNIRTLHLIFLSFSLNFPEVNHAVSPSEFLNAKLM